MGSRWRWWAHGPQAVFLARNPLLRHLLSRRMDRQQIRRLVKLLQHRRGRVHTQHPVSRAKSHRDAFGEQARSCSRHRPSGLQRSTAARQRSAGTSTARGQGYMPSYRRMCWRGSGNAPPCHAALTLPVRPLIVHPGLPSQSTRVSTPGNEASPTARQFALRAVKPSTRRRAARGARITR